MKFLFYQGGSMLSYLYSSLSCFLKAFSRQRTWLIFVILTLGFIGRNDRSDLLLSILDGRYLELLFSTPFFPIFCMESSRNLRMLVYFCSFSATNLVLSGESYSFRRSYLCSQRRSSYAGSRYFTSRQ